MPTPVYTLVINSLSNSVSERAADTMLKAALKDVRATPESDPAMFTYDPNFSLTANSLTSGLNYQLFNNETLRANVYVNYLQSFNWQSQLTFTGKNLGPVTGTTREIGFKGEVFRGKLSYMVAGYEIERQSAE